jgi:hypothetical protein
LIRGSRLGAEARRIVEEQQALLKRLVATGLPTHAAEGALRTYTSSLQHLLARKQRMKEENNAKKDETRKAKIYAPSRESRRWQIISDTTYAQKSPSQTLPL